LDKCLSQGDRVGAYNAAEREILATMALAKSTAVREQCQQMRVRLFDSSGAAGVELSPRGVYRLAKSLSQTDALKSFQELYQQIKRSISACVDGGLRAKLEQLLQELILRAHAFGIRLVGGRFQSYAS